MRFTTICVLVGGLAVPATAQRGNAPAANDPVKTLVARLDLEKYKATIKGLTQFGDRRQGTDRNRAAIDWIEAQLKSYGCANTERLQYNYPLAARGSSGSLSGDPSARRRAIASCSPSSGSASADPAISGALPTSVTSAAAWVAISRSSALSAKRRTA